MLVMHVSVYMCVYMDIYVRVYTHTYILYTEHTNNDCNNVTIISRVHQEEAAPVNKAGKIKEHLPYYRQTRCAPAFIPIRWGCKASFAFTHLWLQYFG